MYPMAQFFEKATGAKFEQQIDILVITNASVHLQYIWVAHVSLQLDFL
jgi:hypothetical protein